MNLPKDTVIKYLKQLDKLDVIWYTEKTEMPRMTWVQSRINQRHIKLQPELYHSLKQSAQGTYEMVFCGICKPKANAG